MINSKQNNPTKNRTVRKAAERFCRRHGHNVPMLKTKSSKTKSAIWYSIFTNTIVFVTEQAAEKFVINNPWQKWERKGNQVKVCLFWAYAEGCGGPQWCFSVTAERLSYETKRSGMVGVIDITGKYTPIPPKKPYKSGRVRKVSVAALATVTDGEIVEVVED